MLHYYGSLPNGAHCLFRLEPPRSLYPCGRREMQIISTTTQLSSFSETSYITTATTSEFLESTTHLKPRTFEFQPIVDLALMVLPRD
ncbi:hypothetical protein Y032_0320g2380 [Ancylostoma ceylanicum]|uniref:Uncharacterized protein n=1 Tax=Ancylostoma ceylanicum TaxID=53326 RepID=A0A016S0T5_9BILA|nr:hypothetical protein Y032_0320g2380 [Ancylostoma ceylanicum]